MFEQSMVGAQHGMKKPAAVSAAAMGQVVIAAGALLYPLMRIAPPEKITLRAPGLWSRSVELIEMKPTAVPTARAAGVSRPLLSLPRFDARRVSGNEPVEMDEAPQVGPGGGGEIGPVIPGWIGPAMTSGPAPPPQPAAVAPKPPASKPAVEPAPAPRAPVRVGGQVQPPSVVSAGRPVYPPLAVQTRTQGVVRLEAVIAKDGRITSLRALSGHPLLVPAALAAVRSWRYEPTLLNGEPVEVALAIDVNFTLGSR